MKDYTYDAERRISDARKTLYTNGFTVYDASEMFLAFSFGAICGFAVTTLFFAFT